MTQKQLKHLVGKFHNQAYLWSKQCMLGHPEDAQEVLQITYLKILEGKARYGGKSNVKTWLFSIIRYTAIDFIKSRRNNLNIETMEIVSTINESEETYHHLLSHLSEKQRQVLLLVFYHNMTLKEVAKTMELGIGTIGQHYYRGKKKLKELIIQQREEFTTKSRIYG